MLDQSKDEETIFKAAAKLQTPAERIAYVRNACGNDSTLLARLTSLLDVHSRKNNLLDVLIPDPDVILDDSPISEGPGTTIGRYKLLEKIGEGGMAVVYMAEQTEPIRRKVALKIIKLGMDTKSVIARFEAERQALAMMDHPNIAKVLDAGATETGRPYFVMELVKGVSITDYCDANSLSTKERLELFTQVCNAVQHAHQKGIIHRDIKPTNVMVTLHDGKSVPKVIDFGIAKAINQKLTEKTLFTRYAHIIGTPAYMSPEQAELSDLDIDTRTDIYSLGVLLYELLTGTTPFGEEELRKAGYIEMQRVIREQEPTKPSTKLSTLGKTLTDIAKHRNSTPDLLRRAVRGDLDWIVMKSLEKDRARRYETANGLALDIRRHIEHEPVMARGPSTTYRLQRFLRRHRSQTVAALAMVIFAGAVTAILSMWNQARLQLGEAEGLRDSAILSQAREQYAKADREAALETIKPILDSRHVGPEAQLLYAGILVDNRRSDEAMTILNSLLDEPPAIAGAAHSLLARILYESESPDAETLKQAEEHRQKAQALLPETAEAHFLQAMFAMTVKDQFGALNRALRLDSQHYESRRLRAFTYYASRKYDRLRDDALVMTILRPRDPLGYSLRAIALRELSKYAEAIKEYDNAIGLLTKADPQYADLSAQRCETLLRMGDYERLIADAQDRLKLWPDRAVFQYYTFSALTALGDYDKAEAVFREIVGRTPTARNEFREWCAKYVFDTLEAGRSWHLAGHEPTGAAFLPMVEAEETYHELSGKAKRVIADAFSAQWSPDGKKLAFSMGVLGYSGVAIFDPATKETELLIVPGKDPRWSPDGKCIAFVRDCQALRLEELATAERKDEERRLADEEVWVMKSDGTEPRRLAAGGWPSWDRDSTHVYYHSRVDKALCSVSIVGPDTKPRRLMACSNNFPSVSPDGQRVAHLAEYMEGTSFKITDLASQAVVAEWSVPFGTWGWPCWSPAGDELCLGILTALGGRTGLWIYRLDGREPVKVLGGPIPTGSGARDGTKFVFHLRAPYFEIWTADLDPKASTVEALGPTQTVEEHVRDMIAFYTRRIEADPEDADAYAWRAGQYSLSGERLKADADMRRWSAVMCGRSPSELEGATPRNIRRIINGPFGYEFVFSAERPVNVNEIPLLNIALGQKGRCNMKSFQIPILSMSLFGLCLLSGLDTPPARADFTFGEPTNLGPTVNSSNNDYGAVISPDGLELYFCSNRPGGRGGYDIWVTTRATMQDPWGAPANLGAQINTSDWDGPWSMSPDGLTLYIEAGPSAEHLCTITRTTRAAPWGPRVSLGPAVNASSFKSTPIISTDGLELFFGRSDGIWVSTRATPSDPWGTPENLGPIVNSPAIDAPTWISPDGLTLFFFSTRAGGYGTVDTWITRRPSNNGAWGPPTNLGPSVNTEYPELITSISSDGQWCYVSDFGLHMWGPRPGGLGGSDLWLAPILPIVDFNADGKVDIADVAIMIEHWHTDYALCDIGPMPWGDGFVDAQDLIVLAEYMANNPADANGVQ